MHRILHEDGAPTVAILPAMDFWEEWIDHLGVSFEEFEEQLMGSFIFSYAQALSRAGWRTVLMLFTRRASGRSIHAPTGSVIRYLPPMKPYTPLERILARPRLRDRRLPGMIAWHVLPYLATSIIPLARALREEKCDAIIHQEYECARYDVVAPLARALRIPIYPSFHAGFPRSRFEQVLHPLTVPLASGLIVSAEAEALRVAVKHRVPPGKVARIPNPIDLRAWRPADRVRARAALGLPDTATVVAWHGAVYLDIKGLDLLLEAWARVTSARPGENLHLLLVGGGRDGPDVRALIGRSDAPNVHFEDRFLHDRAELRQRLAAADVYAFASRTEGYPNSLLEAMACGLPLVATDIAGIPDIVGRGASAGGLLVPPADVGALAEALGRLIDDPDLRKQLSEQARQRVSNEFSLDTVGAQFARLMSSI